MEVKIKQGKEMIDATIDMVDGVMVVSPKEVFKPKNGDVIVCSNNLGYWTLIVREMEPYNIVRHHAVLIDNGILKINNRSSFTNPRYATEEEKKKLFDKLAEEGYSWDADRKELVKIKWKPKDHEKVYVAGFTFYGDNPFCAFEDTAYSGSMKWRAVFERGWYFKTEQECQEFCDKLNQAINQIKP